MRLPRRFAPRNDNHPHPALSPQGRGSTDNVLGLNFAPYPFG